MIALMYHDVVAPGRDDQSGFPGVDCARYKVTHDTFDAHLAALDSASDVIITFDDGGRSAMTAADALETCGRRGWFFITCNYIGSAGFVDRVDIRELADRGHVVGSHSCSHPLRMGHCARTQLLDEWARSRMILESIVGDEIRVASVPGGDFAPKVAETAAEAGFRMLFTSEPTTAERAVDGLRLVGRYTIQRSTSAGFVARLAAGGWMPRAQQAALWTAKKLAKRLGGSGYLKARKLLLGHGDEVRWGDRSL
jgi:peptidoglycan/xylan/chitin deacetylase (PgdA/CDA1 family)